MTTPTDPFALLVARAAGPEPDTAQTAAPAGPPAVGPSPTGLPPAGLPPTGPADAEAARSALARSAPGARLLVVDDDDNIRTLLRLALEAEGYLVATAVGGPQALGAVERFDPDLVLLDVMMPQLDGFRVAEWLRGSKRRAAVLFLTACDNADERGRAAALGAGFMTKPFQLTDVVQMVRGMLATPA